MNNSLSVLLGVGPVVSLGLKREEKGKESRVLDKSHKYTSTKINNLKQNKTLASVFVMIRCRNERM